MFKDFERKTIHGQRGTGFHEYALELSSKIGPNFTASPESAFKGQGRVECPEVERKDRGKCEGDLEET